METIVANGGWFIAISKNPENFNIPGLNINVNGKDDYLIVQHGPYFHILCNGSIVKESGVDSGGLSYSAGHLLEDLSNDTIVKWMLCTHQWHYLNGDREFTDEQYLEIVNGSAKTMLWIPDRIITEDVALGVVNKRALDFFFLPKSARTKNVIKAAITKKSHIFYELDSSDIDEDLVKFAIKFDPTLVRGVPHLFRTKEMFAWIANNVDNIDICLRLNGVPDGLLDDIEEKYYLSVDLRWSSTIKEII